MLKKHLGLKSAAVQYLFNFPKAFLHTSSEMIFKVFPSSRSSPELTSLLRYYKQFYKASCSLRLWTLCKGTFLPKKKKKKKWCRESMKDSLHTDVDRERHNISKEFKFIWGRMVYWNPNECNQGPRYRLRYRALSSLRSTSKTRRYYFALAAHIFSGLFLPLAGSKWQDSTIPDFRKQCLLIYYTHY